MEKKRPPAAAPVAADEGYRVERERNIRRPLAVLKMPFWYVNKMHLTVHAELILIWCNLIQKWKLIFHWKKILFMNSWWLCGPLTPMHQMCIIPQLKIVSDKPIICSYFSDFFAKNCGPQLYIECMLNIWLIISKLVYLCSDFQSWRKDADTRNVLKTNMIGSRGESFIFILWKKHVKMYL